MVQNQDYLQSTDSDVEFSLNCAMLLRRLCHVLLMLRSQLRVQVL
jgi:hypothetical protein